MSTKRAPANAPFHAIVATAYPSIVEQATRFVESIRGTGTKRSSYHVELLTLGWIHAQPWFALWRSALLTLEPTADVFEHAQDIALQAASDATNGTEFRD